MLLTYFLNDFVIVPVAPIITGINFVFTFHLRRISIIIIVVVVIVDDDNDDDDSDDDDGSGSGGSDIDDYRDEHKDMTVLTTVWTVIKNKVNLPVQCHLLITYWNLFLRTRTFFIKFFMKQQLWETESLGDKTFKCCSHV